MGTRFEAMLEEYGPDYILDVPAGEGVATIADDAALDIAQSFGRTAPLIIEVGPGSGEQLIAAALAHPHINYLGVEAWHPGVARCVSNIVRHEVNNIRILEADAAQALPILAPSLYPAAEVWTFFPDPWRKARHHKRRLVNADFATTVARLLEPSGYWRLATDWDNYAWTMRDVVEQSPYFDNPYSGRAPETADEGLFRGGFAPRWGGRILTRFESRGIEVGRSIHDVCGQRTTTPVTDAKA